MILIFDLFYNFNFFFSFNTPFISKKSNKQTNKQTNQVAWEIVEEVAKDPTVDKETKSLLLLPTWNPTKQSEGIHSHQIPSIFKSFVTPQEGPVASSFSSVYQKMGPLAFFSADGFCVRFQGLMDSLVECERKREREGGEEVCLSVLGECKRFSFSDSVLGSMDDTAILVFFFLFFLFFCFFVLFFFYFSFCFC